MIKTEAEILKNIIQNRRSIFPNSYLQKEIEKTVITQILESANYAPTHKLTQPWRFVVMQNENKNKLGETLAKLYKENVDTEKFLPKKYDSFTLKTQQAACIIAINVQLSPEKLPEWEEIAAVACAVQNMSLTAHALSVGTYWSSPPLIHQLNDFLNLAENEKCIGLFYMGYHNETPNQGSRTPIADKVKWMD